MFHRTTVPSPDPEARLFPSGQNARKKPQDACPVRVCIFGQVLFRAFLGPIGSLPLGRSTPECDVEGGEDQLDLFGSQLSAPSREDGPVAGDHLGPRGQAGRMKPPAPREEEQAVRSTSKAGWAPARARPTRP